MVPVHDDSDRGLVERWTRHADERAWSALMRRYDPLVRRTLAVLGLRQSEDVEDLLQDFWWEQSRTVKRWKGDSSLGTYLSAAARRRGIDVIRKRIRQRRTEATGERDWDAVPAPGVADTERRQLKEALERSFARLDVEDRLLFFYREVEGWSVEETAKALNLAEGTVKSRLFRVKQRLREMMKEEGWDADALA